MWMRGVGAVSMAMLMASQYGYGMGPGAIQNAGPAGGLAIALPAGTKVPLTLVSAIKSKSTKLGDTVRGQVAFPVTVGEGVAIPAGTYVEGTLTKLAVNKAGKRPDVEIHFTRLLYANGYSVSLDAQSEMARLGGVGDGGEVAVDARTDGGDGRAGLKMIGSGTESGSTGLGFGFVCQEEPTPPALPPLPQSGPSPIVIGAAVSGGVAAVGIAAILTARHRAGNKDVVLLDAGWQFEMVTVSAVTLDGARVEAAAGLGQ